MRPSAFSRAGCRRLAAFFLLAVLSAAPRCAAVVIDDFSVGAITLETSGEFDFKSANQNGLPTANVAGGLRSIMLQEGGHHGLSLGPDDNVSIEIDPADGGSLTYRADGGLSGINTYLMYESPIIDLTAGGENALVLSFAGASFPGARAGDGRGYFDLSLAGTGGSGGTYVAVPTIDRPFEVVIEFAALPSFDPTSLTYLLLGSGNGNLPGEFVLTEIASRRVLEGDYNRDGVVDAADFTLLRTARQGYYEHRRPDGITALGLASEDVWRANFGAVSASAAVPEPGASALLLAALFAARAGPRRRG